MKIQELQPYLHRISVDDQIIGISKISEKLRQQVNLAAKDLKPIILQAAPGSGKTFISSLIHLHSELKDYPFAEIDLAQLPRNPDGSLNTDSLFGGVNGQWGIIELLEKGTLLIDNVQLLSCRDCDRLKPYLKTGEILTNQQKYTSSRFRLILASPQQLSLTDINAHEIKLSTLSQRKQDIADFAQYFLTKFSQERGRPILELSQADLRRLISYDYPENLAELENILKRATIMTPAEQTIIPEQVLWSVQSQKNTFRLDLLNQIPWLRPFLLSDWYPEGFWVIMMLVFVPITVMGFIGPQTRESSLTLNLFWAWWWPLSLLLFPIVGRLWCAVCPFMITAEWVRKLFLWLFPRQLRRWDTKWLNKWSVWLLWGGFALIYLWEKLWDLPHTAYLSASLLLIITTGAVTFSLIYERRLWCRYLCPIGGMNGMFAKLAVIELRSTQQVCGVHCKTTSCYKGSDATPLSFANPLPSEGQATEGCPLYSHPAQLTDNRDCMLCMSCLKGCPNRSAHFNFRFPATDILEHYSGNLGEIALLLLLLGGVFMHYSQRILNWLGWGNLQIDSDHLLIALPVVTILLSIPAIITYFTHQTVRLFDPEMPEYSRVIYAYLPMTLAANFVYYLPAMITEAGQILPVIARTFGYGGESLPTLTWSMDVAIFLQQITLFSVLAFSLFLLVKITKRPLVHNLPHITLMTGFIVTFFLLIG